MTDKSVRTSSSDRGIEQAIVALKKGAQLLKCGRRGKPEFCHFRLSMDEKALLWYSGEKEKHLKLNTVSTIISGQKTVNFIRQRQPEKESQSFSLIYQNGECSLDLICKDKQQSQTWFLGLTALVSISHQPRPLANIKKSRGAHSCINSPVSHTQRKHKLGLLQDSTKYSEVRSLHGSPPRSLIERQFYDTFSNTSTVSYSSSQKTLSDTKPLWNKIRPPFPLVMSNMAKEAWECNQLKEGKMILIPGISSSDHEIPALEGTHFLKDVFIWGEGVGGVLSGNNKCHDGVPNFDGLLPKLLESTRMLDVKSISLGEKHASIITEQGEVFCWGEENCGRLGHKLNMDVHYPKVVESLATVSMNTISCGSRHTCAVSSSGELYAWGDTSHGVSFEADGCTTSQWFPRNISSTLEGICISKVACGEWHTAVLSSSGQLFTYGDGTFGVLGHGNLQSICLPKEVESLKGLRVKCVACGPWHTSAVVETKVNNFKTHAYCGKLYTWGDNDRGRLGHSDKEKKLLPTCVTSLSDCDFVQVSCGRVLTVALTRSGIVFTMGSSRDGQLGNPRAQDSSITIVEGFFDGEVVKDISSGSSHVAVLTTKGKVYTWGKGSNGRLGLGDISDRNSPTLVEALEDRYVQNVTCGSSFTAAICLHKSVSQSVCSGCNIDFRFPRKKHNCYNCGSVFCHSCSSRRSTNASLAPEKNKQFRVCDPCFNHLEKLSDLRVDGGATSTRGPLISWKGSPDQKINGEDSYRMTRMFPNKASTHEGIKLAESRALGASLEATQRWGKVSCPRDFNHSSHMPMCILPRVTSRKQDLANDMMAKEDIQTLQLKASTLAQQCSSNSQRLHLYQCQIEELRSVARDEAENCKAAKDIIKLLTDQLNSFLVKLPAVKEKDNSRQSSELSVIYNDAQSDTDSQISSTTNQTMPLIDAVTGDDECQTVSDCQSITETPKSDWIEQDERGVYITFTTLGSGKKGIKRVRFSRKHFSAKQAERWWEDNQNRIYVKYHTERFVTSAGERPDK